MSKRVGRYSDKIREDAGIEYAITGNIMDVHKSTKIPVSTLRMWLKEGKWDEVMAEVRASNTSRNIAQYDRLTHKALQAAEQGIDGLDGTSLSAADIKALVISGAATTDKSRLLQQLPGSYSAKASTIDSLSDTFRKLAATHQLVPKSSILEHESDDKD